MFIITRLLLLVRIDDDSPSVVVSVSSFSCQTKVFRKSKKIFA